MPTTFGVVASGLRGRAPFRLPASPDGRQDAISLAIGGSARTGRDVHVAKEAWT